MSNTIKQTARNPGVIFDANLNLDNPCWSGDRPQTHQVEFRGKSGLPSPSPTDTKLEQRGMVTLHPNFST